MKKIISAIVSAMLILTLTLGASASTVITVSGTGETSVSADTAIVNLGVNVRDAEVVVAQQRVNERIASIREGLESLGIPAENVNTNYLNIYGIYEYENDKEQIKSYEASSSLSIKVSDIDLVGRVIDIAFEYGANTLDGISFSASDTKAATAESLEKAVTDAKAKAETLAAASGLQISGITAINEGGTYSYGNSVGNFSAADTVEEAAKGSETVVSAAKVIVNATVNVTFEAE